MAEMNYRKLCVTKRKNEYFYPKTIPKERGLLVYYISIILCLILFLGNYFTGETNSTQTIILQYAYGIIFSVFLQIIYRMILMLEEYQHLTSRYNGNFLTLLSDSLHFNVPVWITVIFCAICCACSSSNFSSDEITYKKVVLISTNIYILGKILNLSDCPLNDSLWVAKNNGLDYGSGMAYSFFHGYLKLVLPKTGTAEKNLEEIMKDYEDRNGVKFEAYKLFILIPKSMRCFVSLQNEYSSVEESRSLDEKVITVAGVKNRVYKNAVYKIVSENGRRCYVSAEYATPLKTFKDVVETRGLHSEYYNKLKKDIILQFYLTLGTVLQEKGLSHFCELIYYEDSYEDSNGEPRYYDVGKIIQARLKELRKNN